MDILTFFKTNKNNIIIGIISLIVLGGIIGIIVYYTNKSSSPTPSSNNCPNNCSGNGTCSDITNTCSCNSGYSGPDCSNKIISCPGDCTDSDHGTCNTDGTCSCKPGFTGSDCSSKTCLNNCTDSDHGTCNSDGTCSCKPGFTGDDCSSKTCPACGKHQSCNSKNGTCFCDSGYILDITGDCIKPCPKPCLHGGVCDEDTGLCTCSNQWKGDDCSQTTCPTALCGTGDSPICCKNNESCVNGVCCDTNKICKDVNGNDTCCANGCCPDKNGKDSTCCPDKYSCTTSDGCCPTDQILVNPDGSKSCCSTPVCLGSCCNGKDEVCDSTLGCRTKCGDILTCDPRSETCTHIKAANGKDDLYGCSNKLACKWKDVIYDPVPITTGPDTDIPLYKDNVGNNSWCYGTKEPIGNLSRTVSSNATTDTMALCKLGDCYARLSDQNMNYVSFIDGQCNGIITAGGTPDCKGPGTPACPGAPPCNNTCPLDNKNPESCCKDDNGSYNGLICPESTPLCIDNKCYSGYNLGPDLPNQFQWNICVLSSDQGAAYKDIASCSNASDLCIDPPDRGGDGHKYHYDKVNNICTLNVIGEACTKHEQCLGNYPDTGHWHDGTEAGRGDSNGIIVMNPPQHDPGIEPDFARAACLSGVCTDTSKYFQLYQQRAGVVPSCTDFYPGSSRDSRFGETAALLPGVKTWGNTDNVWWYAPKGVKVDGLDYVLCTTLPYSSQGIDDDMTKKFYSWVDNPSG